MQPRLLRKQPIKALVPCIRLKMNNVHYNEIFPQKTFLLYSKPFFPPSSLHLRSPALIGCFVVDRKYFEEIGLLDEGMEIYGGENVELGIRVSRHEKKMHIRNGNHIPTPDILFTLASTLTYCVPNISVTLQFAPSVLERHFKSKYPEQQAANRMTFHLTEWGFISHFYYSLSVTQAN